MSDAAENIEAINAFFHDPSNAPKTQAATAAMNEWVRWYEANKPGAFGWWSDDDFDHARNLRNAFNRANAVTTAEKQQVEQVIRTGQSAEQSQGETDRRNASGDIVEHPPGALHSPWFWAGVAGATGIVLAVAGPKLVSLYLGKKL